MTSFTRGHWCLALVMLGVTAMAPADDALHAAATGMHRTEANIARNAWRHPVETLTFFGISPDMTVLEVWPGSRGWYTEVLAPYLRDKGRLIAANYSGETDNPYRQRGVRLFAEKLAAEPDVYGRVQLTTLAPPAAPEGVVAGSIDFVLTARNLHNWVRDGQAEAMFSALFDLLRPGGTLGLVAHRGTPEMVGAEAAKSGYLAESEALRLAAAAGFEFEASSEVNANPRDTRDHPRGVWTLPPTLRMGDEDRDKYVAIGESDRMTMRFRKPL